MKSIAPVFFTAALASALAGCTSTQSTVVSASSVGNTTQVSYGTVVSTKEVVIEGQPVYTPGLGIVGLPMGMMTRAATKKRGQQIIIVLDGPGRKTVAITQESPPEFAKGDRVMINRFGNQAVVDFAPPDVVGAEPAEARHPPADGGWGTRGPWLSP